MLRVWMSIGLVVGALSAVGAEKAYGTVFLGNLQSGKSELLSSYFGKGPVVLNFWATYCVPCKKEMPALQKMMSGHSSVKLIFINIDERSKGPKVRELVSSWGITQTVLLDIYQVAAKKYIPDLKVPATYLINSKGEVVYRSIGYTEKTLPEIERRLPSLK